MFRVCGERVRYLTSDEEKSLFEKLDGCEWLKGIVLFALHTGMRRGEICGLQWFDLNFERRLIHVRNTKNGKDRLIPMNATVRTLLGNQAKTSTYVFPSPRTGERLVEIKYSFVRAIKDAKITALHFPAHGPATPTVKGGAQAFPFSSVSGCFGLSIVLLTIHSTQEVKAERPKQSGVAGKRKTGERRATLVFYVTTA